jgi:lipopolysaccharide export system protein LptA
VEVSQRGREARSDSAFYDDRNETLRLTGNVHLKRESEWLSCREVFISVKNETFEARGVAESRFNL